MLPEFILVPLSCTGLLIILGQSVKLRKLTSLVKQQGKLLATVNEEMKALLICEKGMGQRIKQQQLQVRNVIDRQDRLEVSDGSYPSYKQAAALLQRGVSTDELVDACDLSRGELELLSRMKVASIAKSGRQAT